MKMSNLIKSTQLPPLRTFDDFVLESARFQLPNFQDLEKWGNRVASNLLYYQSNYFLLWLIIFTIVGILQPLKMLGGTAIILATVLISWYATSWSTSLSQWARRHSIISASIVLFGLYLIMNMLDSILIFSIGMLLPVSVIFLHASSRLRNLRNKFANQAETFNLKQTPMGSVLKELGLLPDIF